MSRLRIERTVSFQVEGPGESYCATTYSLGDAKLVASLARTIPRLKCLRNGGKQPRGIYAYKKGYPVVETYDRRLAQLVHQHIKEIKGDL